jgi:hypothetical protein
MLIFRIPDISSSQKCRICRAGASQYLLINIKVHQDIEKRCIWPEEGGGRRQRLFGTPILRRLCFFSNYAGDILNHSINTKGFATLFDMNERRRRRNPFQDPKQPRTLGQRNAIEEGSNARGHRNVRFFPIPVS